MSQQARDGGMGMSWYRAGIAAMAVLYGLAGNASEVRAADVEELLRDLQAQVSALHETVAAQAAEIRDLKARLDGAEAPAASAASDGDTARVSAAHAETHLTHERGLAPTMIGHIAVSGGLTGIVQGTAGNGDNVDEEGDVIDGSWSADLELEAPLGENGTAFVLIEAGQGDGLQDDETLTFHGVNGDAGDSDASLDIAEAWYEHWWFEDRLVLTIGKIDPTNYVDTNQVANDERYQFLSGGLVNSLAIEFPEDRGGGARLGYYPNEFLDFNLVWAEADADWDDFFDDGFVMGELALHPVFGDDLAGNYRLHAWYDSSDKESLDGSRSGEDGYGFGVNIDQKVHALVTLFGRVNWQDDEVYEVEWAWSAGAELSMAFAGRPDDALAAAFGQAITSDEMGLGNEEMVEVYYRLQLTDHLGLSPHVQYFWNPMGDSSLDDFAVLGIRGQVSF